MNKRYLIRVMGVLYKYTRYVSGNCTRKNLYTGARAERITVEQLEHDIAAYDVIEKYESVV